jgi:hypothetical protein
VPSPLQREADVQNRHMENVPSGLTTVSFAARSIVDRLPTFTKRGHRKVRRCVARSNTKSVPEIMCVWAWSHRSRNPCSLVLGKRRQWRCKLAHPSPLKATQFTARPDASIPRAAPLQKEVALAALTRP